MKRVNDTEGHLAGDAFIASAVNSLRDGMRSYDLIVRYGGDEFVCCLPRVGQVESGDRFEEIVDKFQLSRPGMSFSFGVAEYERGVSTLDELIELADADLYRRRRQSEAGVSY